MGNSWQVLSKERNQQCGFHKDHVASLGNALFRGESEMGCQRAVAMVQVKDCGNLVREVRA